MLSGLHWLKIQEGTRVDRIRQETESTSIDQSGPRWTRATRVDQSEPERLTRTKMDQSD
jgi:hypothetical protein